jgi:hypothetical protein
MFSNAIWIASIFGPFLTIVGIWMLTHRDLLMKSYSSIKGTPSVMYLRSVINMLLGLYVISMYNMWVRDASLLVTLLGWALFLRGLVTLFAPDYAVKAGLSDQKILHLRGIVPLIWGLLLIWLAFWH